MDNVLTKGIYNNSDPALKYTGTWGTFLKQGDTMVYSSTKGDYLYFAFMGTGFTWYSQINAWRGKAKVYIDGIDKGIVDTYSENEFQQVAIYSINDLSDNEHTCKIEVLGQKSNNSLECKVVIYKIEILDDDKTEDYEIKIMDNEENIDISKAIESKDLINEGIFIANEGETLEVGENIKIIAHILPYNVMATNQYIIKSSNESIIAVNGGKVIEAKAVGQAIITAYTIDGKYKDSIKYNVKEKEELLFSSSDIYNLEINRFGIIVNDSSQQVAINNSQAINAALKYCGRYGYKKNYFSTKSFNLY